MNKRFVPIQLKIWLSILITIALLLLVVVIINLTIVNYIKNDFIFDQLKNSAQAKRLLSEGNKELDDYSMWVAHYRFVETAESPILYFDRYIKRVLEQNSTDFYVIELITDKVLSNKNRDIGTLKYSGKLFYYYVDWGENRNEGFIFLTSRIGKSAIPIEFVILTILLLIVSYFTSKFVSKKISNPILEIENFSKDIAEKKWDSTLEIESADEIGQLAKSLNEMKLSLKDAEEQQHIFLQSTSHDLKTPVMVIKGYAQALLDGIKLNGVDPAQIIIEESELLERKISQLLHINTIQFTINNQKKEIVRVDRVIVNIVSKMKVLSKEVRWNLDLFPLEIEANGDSLFVAFENILDNQIRFAKKNINIKITENRIIEISNDGPKFTSNNPNSLFEMYKKDKFGKFGLGLSIVKQVVDSLKGEVTAENDDIGVKFTITL